MYRNDGFSNRYILLHRLHNDIKQVLTTTMHQKLFDDNDENMKTDGTRDNYSIYYYT